MLFCVVLIYKVLRDTIHVELQGNISLEGHRFCGTAPSYMIGVTEFRTFALYMTCGKKKVESHIPLRQVAHGHVKGSEGAGARVNAVM